MPATVTLAQATLAEQCDASQTIIKVSSTAGMLAGMYLFIDGELMRFTRTTIDPWIEVRRGADCTAGLPHGYGAVIYFGQPHQFYKQDPVGKPAAAIPVSPYINVQNGKIWFAQGDPSTASTRWWQPQTTSYSIGPLGVRVSSVDITAST